MERTLKVFIEFGLVEVLPDGAFYMADMQLLIGHSSTEGERKKKERMKLEQVYNVVDSHEPNYRKGNAAANKDEAVRLLNE